MKTSTFYNILSPFYPVIDIFLKPHKRYLINEVNSLPSTSLLEIGCGHGNYLSEYKNHTVTAIDFSANMLKIAKSMNDNVRCIKADATELPFDSETFGCIVCAHVLSTTSNAEQIIDEAIRVLQVEGKLILLNNTLPTTRLSYAYHLVNPISRLFHFQSNFQFKNIKSLLKLDLTKQVIFGYYKSYQLRVYKKP